MADDQTILRFVSGALDAGVPYDALVGLLRARGWREREIYKALGQHYSHTTGIEIPSRAGSAAGAKDAFFYLLTFSTLATWTIGLGSLAFQLIDRWLADPLFTSPYARLASYEITWALAAILIAFPVYLLISRITLRETASDPDKLDSGVRKWLTYMALVIAASIFMGDLINALAFLLRGELTSRFLAKSFVVLTLSGGVFYYYFGGLRRTEASAARPNRDRLMAIVSIAVVALIVILGFGQLGSPRSQRDERADTERVRKLYMINSQIQNYSNRHGSGLPASLDQLPGGDQTDPITHQRFEYIPGTGTQYQLCATFNKAADDDEAYGAANIWHHPAGHYCFALDTKVFTPYPQD